MKQKADYTLDFRGSIASMTLLELTNVFREMKTDEIIEIYVNKPDTVSDIFKVLPESAFELNDLQDEHSEYVIRIKKQPV